MKIIICTFFPFLLFSQNNVIATGTSATNSNGSISVSVGQINYLSKENNNGSLSGGNQQAFEIYSLSTGELKNLKINFFPNPTNDFLILQMDDFFNNQLKMELIDSKGLLIFSSNLNTLETKINVKEYAGGTYFLKISDSNKLISTYKILKK